MSDQIDLHDSRVVIHFAADTVVFRFCPAYVHHWHRSSSGWRGEGRSQSAEIVIAKGFVAPRPGAATYEVSGGWLQVGPQRYENLIPVPLADHTEVRVRLELVNAEAVEVEGRGVAIRLVGEPEVVEDLPPEWAPSRDAV